MDIMNYSGHTTVTDYTDKLQTGVCRHYSLLAKRLYDHLAKKNNLYGSSVLYNVSNPSISHAYNYLQYEDKD